METNKLLEMEDEALNDEVLDAVTGGEAEVSPYKEMQCPRCETLFWALEANRYICPYCGKNFS